MLNFKEFLIEKTFRELHSTVGKWVFLNKSGDTTAIADNLIELVQNAYKSTSLGSFVNNISDVKRSFYWEALDWDEDPEADVVVFGRKPRGDENWKGIKIQGIGHDGQRISIDAALTKLAKKLKEKGFWIEASDALEHILYKKNVSYIQDEETAKKIFPDLQFTGEKGKYIRKTGSGQIKETIFGRPIV